MDYSDYLLEGGEIVRAVQVQLLFGVVFMAQDPDRFMDHVRALSALKRRIAALARQRGEAVYGGPRVERSRL